MPRIQRKCSVLEWVSEVSGSSWRSSRRDKAWSMASRHSCKTEVKDSLRQPASCMVGSCGIIRGASFMGGSTTVVLVVDGTGGVVQTHTLGLLPYVPWG